MTVAGLLRYVNGALRGTALVSVEVWQMASWVWTCLVGWRYNRDGLGDLDETAV